MHRSMVAMSWSRKKKIVYDMEYIEKRSVLMDIKCLAKTVSLIFTHEGAR